MDDLSFQLISSVRQRDTRLCMISDLFFFLQIRSYWFAWICFSNSLTVTLFSFSWPATCFVFSVTSEAETNRETRFSSSRTSLIYIRYSVIVTSSIQRHRTNSRWNQSLDQIHSNATTATATARRCWSIHSTMPSQSFDLKPFRRQNEGFSLL